MHPFERSNLGKAPFRCTGVTKNVYQACPEAPVQPAGSCNHCGTCIMWEFHIVGSDGRTFIVGSDCVMKTGDEAEVDGFRAARLKLARDQREAKRQVKYTERKAKWEAEAAVARAAFVAQHPEFVARLEADTSDFARSLWSKLNGWGSLSVPQMEALKNGWARVEAKAAEKANSRHFGVLTKRVSDTFTITHVTGRRADFYPHPMSYWHLMKDSAGNVCTYRGSVCLGNKGETVKAAFTVKEHTEYQGTAQTVLARPKVEVAAVAEVAADDRYEPGHEDTGRDNWKLEAYG